jgi:hypothetical protein
MAPPAATVGGPALTSDRSAEPPTEVMTVEVLFAGVGSVVVLETAAVLVKVPAWFGAVTTTVMVGAVLPAAAEATVQVTETLPVLLQAQPVPEAEMNVTPAGSVSVTDRFAASDGPLLWTTRLYVTVPPAVTEPGPVLMIDRSADAVTVVATVEVLLAGFGSAVVEDTDAVLDSAAACAGAVTTTVINGAVAPVANVALVHVTDTLPALVHTQPVPDADTNVTPAGSVSVTDTLPASDGPASATVNV